MTRLLLLLLLAATLTATAAAQNADAIRVPRTPAIVKYGKWGMLGIAVGFGLKADAAHHDADVAFRRLDGYCRADNRRCDRGANGAYLDPVSEGYYQTSLRRDRQARGWLLGGEGLVLGAAGLFIWELTRPKQPPRNIPFSPELTVGPQETKVGFNLSF